MTQILDSSDEVFKTAVINMIQEAKVYTFEKNRIIGQCTKYREEI